MSREINRWKKTVSPEGLFDKIRSSCRRVSENADYVRINVDQIKEYADSLPLEKIKTSSLDPGCHYLGRGEGPLAFFLILDSINFGSGYFPLLKKRSGMSGYFTIASALNEYFINNGPMDCRILGGLSPADCARLFGQDSENETVGELMELFAKAMNDLGEYVTLQFGGSFSNMVNAAENSCEKFIAILSGMPLFRDVQFYKGLDVHFFKRAQLTCADLALAFQGDGPGKFYDLRRLTIFADNLVPHVLRMDGVLRYVPELLRKIDGGELIPRDSCEEIEIRACALHAVELVRNALRETGKNATSMGLDYLLWNRGQNPFYKKTKPRHRTRTVFY